MPNRVLYTGLLTSKKVNGLSPAEFELYVRLLLVADDFGRFDGSAVRVSRACWPVREDVSSKTVEPLLRKLHLAGLILLYEVDGDRYVQVTNWSQRSRQDASKYPPPTNDGHMTVICQSNDGHVPARARADVDVDVDVDDRRRRKTEPAIPPDVSPSLRESILEFVSHRKAIKKPMTDLAVKKLIDELYKLADNDDTRIAIIDRSIANGWIGVFPPERTQGNRPQRGGRKSNEGNFTGRQYTDEELAAMYTEPPEVSE